MGNKFFNIKKNKSCSCCVFGEVSPYLDEVFCKKRGVCEKRDYCRHFKYDVLKRQPERITPDKDFTPEDFSIEP
ncbi:MAG: hypothetical protein MJ090_06035 [Clostridia bacterium]|nr:hypothetical protein [Clostridia bacterium]